ncbi:MAG: HAD family hydrolase [Promethearchaeota archaeon]
MAIKRVKYLEIDNLFNYIIGESKQVASKQDPNLKHILITIHPKKVGDHPKDKMIAEMMDCPFIGVLTGHHSRKELISNRMHLILESAAEISTGTIFNLLG